MIAIGNPGAGKSTVLNSLSGEVLFESGISIGCGLTYQLDEKANSRGVYFDTPGLADNKLRAKAGQAITTALRKGGNYKILFFVMMESGRVARHDVATLNIVLNSAPEIGNSYAIIINKVPRRIVKLHKDKTQASLVAAQLFIGMQVDRICAPSNIIYLAYDEEMEGENNILVDSTNWKVEGEEGYSLRDFVFGSVPTINLTPGKAKDIEIEAFYRTTDELITKLECLYEELQEFTGRKCEHEKLKFFVEHLERQELIQLIPLENLRQERRKHDQEVSELRQKLTERQKEAIRYQKEAADFAWKKSRKKRCVIC